MKEYVASRGRVPEDVALLKIGADGGQETSQVMIHVLFNDDHLLRQASDPPGRRVRPGKPCTGECGSSSGNAPMSCVSVTDDVMSAITPGELHIVL